MSALTLTIPQSALGAYLQAQARSAPALSSPPRGRVRGVVVGVRRWVRRLVVLVAVLFGVLGFGGGSAQAWPWDDAKDNIAAFVTYFCSPMDVPTPVTFLGPETTLGVNTTIVEGSGGQLQTSYEAPAGVNRSTILPGNPRELTPDARKNIEAAYGSDLDKIKPSMGRYGFEALRWNSYGNSCFDMQMVMDPVTNGIFSVAIKQPIILSMTFLNFAMGNSLLGGWMYAAFSGLVSGMVKLLSSAVLPVMYVTIPIGLLAVFIRSRGNPRKVTQGAVWSLAIVGTMFWMANSTNTVVRVANNAVTSVTGTLACGFADGPSTASFNPSQTGTFASDVMNGSSNACADPSITIQNAIWMGVPYSVWAQGALGTQTAAADSVDGRYVWGSAILNANYIGVEGGGPNEMPTGDGPGAALLKDIRVWNSLDYTPGDNGKAAAWVAGPNDTVGDFDNAGAPWTKIPFLMNVHLMCADQTTVGSGDKSAAQWMYAGHCNSGSVGTDSLVPYVKGERYMERVAVLYSGSLAAFVVALSLILASGYVIIKKLGFYFMLMVAPIFLAIGSYADEKRKAFATRFFELIFANMAQQIVGVVSLLWLSYMLATILSPPADSAFAWMPVQLRPYAILAMVIAILFLLPALMRISKGVAKGDTSVVDKTIDMPKDAAKATAKAAVQAGVLYATGGASALANIGKLAANGQAGTALAGMSRMVGGNGVIGKGLGAASKAMRAREGLQGMLGRQAAQGKGEMVNTVAKSLAEGDKKMVPMRDDKGKLLTDAAGKPRMTVGGQRYERDAKGQLTAAGKRQTMADAKAVVGGSAKDLKGLSPYGRKVADEGIATDTAKFYRDYKQRTGVAHEFDPQAPAGMIGAATNPKFGVDGGRNAAAAAVLEESREVFASPSFARTDVQSPVVTNSSGVLAQIGATSDQVIANPALLLNADAYGGSLVNMDVSHPATAPLTNLTFAIASGDDAAVKVAAERASSVVETYGAPARVDYSYVTGQMAAAYNPVDTAVAMPVLMTDTSAQERATWANGMAAHSSLMPADHPAYDAVRNYTEALANPYYGPDDVNAYREVAQMVLSGPLAPAPAPDPLAALGLPPAPEDAPSYEAPSIAQSTYTEPRRAPAYGNGAELGASDGAALDGAVQLIARAFLDDTPEETRDEPAQEERVFGMPVDEPSHTEPKQKRPRKQRGRWRRTGLFADPDADTSEGDN